jgi:hypothetical protein
MGISYGDREGLKTITDGKRGRMRSWAFLRKAVWGKSSFSGRAYGKI